tara:strand:+ start:185 stop:709 length:525 start_codon:yes stop_codon:yes gene_type:complete
MKRLLINLASGLFVCLTFFSEASKPIRANSLLKSCLNYPYELGISLKHRGGASFQLLSTSVVDIKVDNANFISRGLREANLKAKLNISNFLKLTNGSSDKSIRDLGFPIRINGRAIRTNSQLKHRIKNGFIESSSKLQGINQIAMCNQSSDYVMVTLEVTNKTISASDFIRKDQ